MSPGDLLALSRYVQVLAVESPMLIHIPLQTWSLVSNDVVVQIAVSLIQQTKQMKSKDFPTRVNIKSALTSYITTKTASCCTLVNTKSWTVISYTDYNSTPLLFKNPQKMPVRSNASAQATVARGEAADHSLLYPSHSSVLPRSIFYPPHLV